MEGGTPTEREHVICFEDPGNGAMTVPSSTVALRVMTPQDTTPEILRSQIEDVINILRLVEVEPVLETVMDRLAEVQGYSWEYIEPEFVIDPEST